MSPKYWPPSTKDMEKAAKQKAKEQAASKERARAHKVRVARKGPDPMPMTRYYD
ncbi:hypothetical protein [Streptomyces sp. NBC_00425]|uniref:hypothetical protein n=1 Tax=Streptomyces sp. NBC_00425 TaxID=2975740 RepID=UPI002E215620